MNNPNHPNPHPESEEKRIQVTRSYPVAEPGMDLVLSEACRLAALLCHRPMAAVELVLEDTVVVVASAGLKSGRIARSEALCPEFLEARAVVVVSDARQDERFADRRLVGDARGIRFYAAVPLVSPEGCAVGVLSVWDYEVGDLLPSQSESLEALGRMVMGQLDLGRRQRQLEELEMQHARVEEALREAEAKYRGIVENTVLGIYQTTPEGRYLSANPMLAKIYGYSSPEELMNAVGSIQMEVYTDPTARDRFVTALQQTDLITNFEAQIRRKDGQILWIAETARVVRDELGRVKFYEGTVQDITDRKAAEEKVHTSEILYHSLVEELPQNVFRKDRNEQFIFANSRFCETVGLPPEKVLGKTDLDLFPPELAHKYQADDQRVMAEGRSVRQTERNVTADGAVHWVEVIKTPLRDANGEISGIQGIFWDVTDGKRLEDALAYERDLLQALLDHSPDVIFFKDPQSRFVKVGRSAARWFNVADESTLVGRTLFDLWPEERARLVHTEEQDLLQTGKPIINKVEELSREEGRTIWVSVTKIPIYNRSGETLGLVGVAREITQLKETERALREAEEKFRGIFENSVEGIYQTSVDGRFLRVNPALARIYGYANPEEVMAMVTDVRVQVYVEPGRREEFVRELLSKGSITGFESEIYRKDGTRTWVSESGRVVRDRDGRPQYFEGSLEDVSARKQFDEERDKARQAALDSAKLKAQFVATVSHEIRTPLNAILPTTELLLQGRMDRQQRYLVENIDHGARMLLQVVNDILVFSKIEAGAVELECLEFDVHEVVERTVSFFAGRAHEKRLELIGVIEPGSPRHVLGDPSRLEQVLNNLIGNAIKFTSQGEVVVRLDGGNVEGDKALLRFSVSDTGIGIEEEARPRVFQAFAQADGSMSRRYGGTGLGLTITRKFVELMGGEIDFESEVGKGTTFWFTVRLDRVLQPKSSPAQSTVLAGRRVLILDDSASQRSAIAYAIDMLAPARVESVGTIAAALDSLRVAARGGEMFDLVLFDAELPDSDVLLTARRLRLGAPGADLIALTAPGSLADARGLEAAGVRGTLVKPLRQSKLADEIASVLRGEAFAMEGSILPEVADLPGTGLRVLVVDDNDMNRRVVRGMLERMGAKADTAASGPDAIQACSNQRYDLVLMDCQMPGMDGYEATRRLRLLEAEEKPGSGEPPRPRIPIVALSANALEGDREHGIAAGMDDYLTKPLRQPDLARVLRSMGTPLVVPEPNDGGSSPARSGAPTSQPPTQVPSGSPPGSGPAKPAEQDLPVVDPEPLNALASPDEPNLVAEFIQDYLREAPQRLAAMEAAVAAADPARIRAESHNLKGSSSYMGAARLVRACGALEASARSGDLSRIQEQMEAVRREWREASAALSQRLPAVP
ncbi:MAG: PAS domain S-box protein [Limisphaerales bacterium]